MSKRTEHLKIRAYLMQNFMELDLKKIGPKTSLGQFGPKAFGKGVINPKVQNPYSNIHKQDLIFSRIIRRIQ